MSVRVNLLPQATKDRDRATRHRAGLGLGLVALLLLLGLVYWWGASQVDRARDELAVEEARTAELQAQTVQLVEFQELARRLDESDQLLVQTMGGEVSLAGVLQDLAIVMPPDVELDSFAVNLTGDDVATSLEDAVTVGTFTASGRTLTSHAPGVERLLLELDKVAAFRDVYLGSSDLEDPDERVASFGLDGALGPESLTRRYADGLPEVLR